MLCQGVSTETKSNNRKEAALKIEFGQKKNIYIYVGGKKTNINPSLETKYKCGKVAYLSRCERISFSSFFFR
jgi:hypothetical protein